MTASRVVVIDDHFPTLSSGFRLAEFTELLQSGVVDTVLTTMGPFDDLMAPFAERYPALVSAVRPYDEGELSGYDLAYLIFLNNVDHHLAALERAGLPFVFTLYPGGGFALDDAEVTRKLDRIMASPLLRAIITTQPIVAERVREHYPNAPLRELDAPFPGPGSIRPGAGNRVIADEDILEHGLRLCFVAHRYTATGADKGFPQFVEIVRTLDAYGHAATGDVVGQFTEDDVEPAVRHLFRFHGVLDSAQLRELFASQHVVVSPNQPRLLSPGAFDGFPLTSSVEASLSGVAMLVSDPLGQNRHYRDGREILIEAPDAQAMVTRLRALLREPGGVQRVARAGLRRSRAISDPARQLTLRRAIIEGALS